MKKSVLLASLGLAVGMAGLSSCKDYLDYQARRLRGPQDFYKTESPAHRRPDGRVHASWARK